MEGQQNTNLLAANRIKVGNIPWFRGGGGAIICYIAIKYGFTVSMNLIFAAVLLLISAVAVGLYLVMLGLRQRKRSPGLARTHVGLALSAIAVLFTEIFTGPADKINNLAALFLFFALVGGGLVFALHEKNRPPSMAAVTVHAIMGMAGLSLLFINLF